MAKISEVYPEKWLKSKHLQGKSVRVRVSGATVESLFNPGTKKNERRFVLSFSGKKLQLILSKTMTYAMETITGSDDSDNWAGWDVTLSPTIIQGHQTIQINPATEKAEAGALAETA